MKTTYSFNIWNHILQDGNSKFLAFYVEKFQPFLTVTKLFNWQIVADTYWFIFLHWKGRLAVFLPSLPILRAQHKSQRLTEYMDSLGSETAFTLYKLTVNGCICGKWVLNFKKKKNAGQKAGPCLFLSRGELQHLSSSIDNGSIQVLHCVSKSESHVNCKYRAPSQIQPLRSSNQSRLWNEVAVQDGLPIAPCAKGGCPSVRRI